MVKPRAVDYMQHLALLECCVRRMLGWFVTLFE